MQPMTVGDLRSILVDVRETINLGLLHDGHTDAASACQLELLDVIDRVVSTRLEIADSIERGVSPG